MKKVIVLTMLLAVILTAQRRRRDQDGFFHTQVPEHRFNLTLGRIEARSVTATLLANEPLEGYFTLGSRRTPIVTYARGEPQQTVFKELTPNTRYTYRFHFRKPGQSQLEQTAEYAFHTQRPPGATFTFAVQADSHLDENSSPDVYRKTLNNVLEATPDFLIDLGDTFMTDKRRDDFRAALPQYLAQRYYFGLIGHSVPLFLVLGNHDGEDGSRREMAQWSLAQRTRLFPNPRTASELENYYAFTWGDAVFIALDPYWPTSTRTRGDLWRWTLGKPQYEWLRKTLSESRAKFKFVFIHHPIGANSEPTRGGVEAAKYGEWGGLSADGSNGFAQHRPGWTVPIHQLLRQHGVSIVFHGHDHFFAREELDGMVYQLVPQPGNPRATSAPRNADEYGYRRGVILGGSGYIRVAVSSAGSQVDFVGASQRVEHSYRMEPATPH